MTTYYKYRQKALNQIDKVTGVYVLCDLDEVPIYVGLSMGESIRERLQRHLTSSRSDVIANRQVDVWEVAWVWTYPVNDKDDAIRLESALYHSLHAQSPLMNGTIPRPYAGVAIPPPTQRIRVIDEEEIKERLEPSQRLPRQAEHYAQIVNHFIYVKNTTEVAAAMDAHFKRLEKYHAQLLTAAVKN